MKNIYILLLFCFSLTNYSQNLSLEEVMSLRKLDVANVEERLATKGWSFLSSKEGTEESLGVVDFAFNKRAYDDTADSFLTYYFSNYTGRTRVNLQVHNLIKYNAYLARIKSYGCKLIDSSISDGSIRKVYQGVTTTFMVSVGTQKEDFSSTSKTTYQIFIIENSDYELNFTESE